MPPSHQTPRRDPELERQALDALLEIAWEDEPDHVQQALRAQTENLSTEECTDLLDGFIDRSTLADELHLASQGGTEDPVGRALDEEQATKVDAALEPLIDLVAPEARATLEALAPGQRAHVLFSAVNRRG